MISSQGAGNPHFGFELYSKTASNMLVLDTVALRIKFFTVCTALSTIPFDRDAMGLMSCRMTDVLFLQEFSKFLGVEWWSVV